TPAAWCWTPAPARRPAPQAAILLLSAAARPSVAVAAPAGPRVPRSSCMPKRTAATQAEQPPRSYAIQIALPAPSSLISTSIMEGGRPAFSRPGGRRGYQFSPKESLTVRVGSRLVYLVRQP